MEAIVYIFLDLFFFAYPYETLSHMSNNILLRSSLNQQEDPQINASYSKNTRFKSATFAVLSINFEVDVPTGKVRGSLGASFLGGSGGMPSHKILKFRYLEMQFSMFSRQYLGLKNNQN